MSASEEVLRKAIAKAVDNGWHLFNGVEHDWRVQGRKLIIWRTNVDGAALYEIDYDYEAVIFNKDFARALWGDADIRNNREYTGTYSEDFAPAWQHHLQQMVIADHPLIYLKENL